MGLKNVYFDSKSSVDCFNVLGDINPQCHRPLRLISRC